MKSIRLKLFLGIMLVISIFLCGIFTYGVFFKKYFQGEKLQDMSEVIEKVEVSINEEGINNIVMLVEKLSDEYNVQIEVQDGTSDKMICTTHSMGKGNSSNTMAGHNRFETIKELGYFENIEQLIIHDKSTGVDFLTAQKVKVSDKYTVIVKTPINIMDDAVSKSISFLIMIFLPITILILVFVYIFAKKFTNPIIEITDKTSRITKLDFSDDINVYGRDEISILGYSVNNLSHKIENTLNEINDKNIALEKMIMRERENENIRKEFVSSVSHELKSPIAVISGYAQALQENIISSEEDRKYYIDVINEETKRMQVIVNDLLDLYKLESNTFKLQYKEFYLGELIEKIIKKNQFKFKELNINLKTKIKNPRVIGDEIRLEQAVQNYINNALSHIDEKRELEITVSDEGKISVYNSGTNIENESLERIWQGFVRIDKVRNYKEKRVGLGLAIVKQIIRLHQGSCGVLNRSGGVEFWIKLNTI